MEILFVYGLMVLNLIERDVEMKYFTCLWLIVIVACIPVCNGEAISAEDRLCFCISSDYGSNQTTQSGQVKKPVAPVVNQGNAPVSSPLTLAEQQRLGLVPLAGFQVQGVTPALLQKAINYYIKSREWYDASGGLREYAKAGTSVYTFAADGSIYFEKDKRGIHFYDANKQGKELANTYGVPITATVGGVTSKFACTETPFQAAKINLLVGSTEAQNFVSQFQNQTGGAIQRDVAPRIQRIATAAGKIVDGQFYKLWDDSSVWVMINLVLGKALQNPNDPMINQLIHQIEEGILIVEHTGNDDKWGDGSKVNPNVLGPGENRLGLIWGAVQSTLKDHYNLP